MDEETIAAGLAQKVHRYEPTTEQVVTPVVEEPTNLARTAEHIDIDELTQYKLHDFFGEPYRANDEVKRQQMQYIYTHIAEMVGTQEYGFVVAKMRDMERIIGIAHSNNKIYKMYQWLKLDNMRRNIDAQMSAI